MFDDIGSAAGDQQLTRVGGHTGGVTADLAWVADMLNLHNAVNAILCNAGRIVGVANQLFSQQDHVTGVFGIDTGVTERTTAGFAGEAISVAELITARYAEESHVDIQFTGLDQMYAATVGVDMHRFCQQAVGDGISQFAAQARGVDLAHHTIFNVIDQRRVAVGQRAGGQRQIFKAHFCQFIHHHIDGFIAVTESVVK